MNNEEHIIPSGPLKGKKIEFSPVTGVEMFIDIAEDFMRRIFDLNPGEYLISDESSLSDFTAFDENHGVAVKSRVEREFDIIIDDMNSDRLLDIFMAIHKRTYGP